MNLQVSDSRRLLLKLVGTMGGVSWDGGEGQAKSLQASFRPLITSAVKANLSGVIKDSAIDLLEIDEHLEEISTRLREKLLPGGSTLRGARQKIRLKGVSVSTAPRVSMARARAVRASSIQPKPAR